LGGFLSTESGLSKYDKVPTICIQWYRILY